MDRFSTREPSPNTIIGYCRKCHSAIIFNQHHYEPDRLLCSIDCLREHAHDFDIDTEGLTAAQIIESLQPGYIYDGKWFEDSTDVLTHMHSLYPLWIIHEDLVIDKIEQGKGKVDCGELGIVRVI